jgi:hypothetical protein
MDAQERRMTHRVTGEWIGLKRQQPFPSIDFLDPRSFSVDWDSCVLVRCLAGAATPGHDALEFEFVGRSFRKEAPLCTAGERLAAVPPGSLLSLTTPVLARLFERRSAIIHSGVHPLGRGQAVFFRAIAVPFGDSSGELRYGLGVLSHKLSGDRLRPRQQSAEFLEYRDDAWLRIDAPPQPAFARA